MSTLAAGLENENVGKKARPKTVLEIGRDEPGIQTFLDGCDRASERSRDQYRKLTGMARNRSPGGKPLLQLNADEARVLARELKAMDGGAGICAHMRLFYERNDRQELVKLFKKKPKPNAVDRDDVPTDEEAQAMIDAAPSLKDRALLGALFECGSRIHELLGVRLRDVEMQPSPENGGRKLVTIWFRKSKVPGEQHFFTLVDSATLVAAWLDRYPFPTKGGDAPLFPSEARGNYSGFMTTGGAYKKFVGIAKAAGVREPERFHPHSAKHYAATRMLRKGMSEADVKRSIGWKPNSAMLARYNHLTATDSRNAYLRASGLQVAEAPKVETFAVPTKEVPPIAAPPPSIVDVSDPRLPDLILARVLKDPRLLEGMALWAKATPKEKAAALKWAKENPV